MDVTPLAPWAAPEDLMLFRRTPDARHAWLPNAKTQAPALVLPVLLLTETSPLRRCHV